MHRQASHDAVGRRERHGVRTTRDVAGGVHTWYRRHFLGVGSDDRTGLGVIQLAAELLRNFAVVT